MALSNYERVTRAMELLKQGLGPFVEQEFAKTFKGEAGMRLTAFAEDDRINASKPAREFDVALLLKVMWDSWNDVFRMTLGFAERSLVSELRDHRNNWAHQKTFSSDDTYRVLDSTGRLLSAVLAPQADEIEKMKMDSLRVRFEEQARSEIRKAANAVIEGATSGLKPWREVVAPHPDVAKGSYNQAEFAADLWQVHLGEGNSEYQNPEEFFRRTFLTESLKALLVGAVRRLSGTGGDPVVQLQTNFGGGKTHSMLALFHMFSGAAATSLEGVDKVMSEASVNKLPTARRVVLVGNKISPSTPRIKSDGTVVRTLWGELAWQLGGRPAYDRIRADDENATSPGDVLRELFNEYGPCLILIDEWVAYARQLDDQGCLPAGGFETQFSFAQVLTESAKLAKNCLLVISLPASDTAGSPHVQADDVEVGGIRGREALDRLRNVVGRLESSWRPASAEEGFEIVRRRLFEPLSSEQCRDRAVVARAFADMYRVQHAEFPPECRESEYEKRIRAAYPIHPEIFDRLYNDWSTLVKFQRTRGVLRLMSAVIHSLWEKGDRSPLILPANIAMDDSRVRFELVRYMSDTWEPVIAKDVDGANSLPMRIDAEVSSLGKLAACRRVARTIYLGSAPLAQAAHRGIEDRRIKLGCVMPGESPATFGDALRRLSSTATYLYQDGARYWYSTQPTVTKLADDRAEQLVREPDKVVDEINKRLWKDLQKKGEFCRVHPMPRTGQEVQDDMEAALVVLAVDAPYMKDADNAAGMAARAILESRGNSPRIYRNSLVFLAADKGRIQDLDGAVRKFLAWESVLADGDKLNLDPQQRRQAESQRNTANGKIGALIPETYQWILIPSQKTPTDAVEMQALKLAAGVEPIAERVTRKLKTEEYLYVGMAATRLRMELDRVPLWRGNDVAVKQLAEDFAKYVYLPRLKEPAVLVRAIQDGLDQLTWAQDTFGFAESWDDAEKRYRGLRSGGGKALSETNLFGLLVKGPVAAAQIEFDTPGPDGAGGRPRSGMFSAAQLTSAAGGVMPGAGVPTPISTSLADLPARFHACVEIDPARVIRDISQIADEVVCHLTNHPGATVTVTLEIEAHFPSGAPDSLVRTVTENAKTLKFRVQGFERD